jgi:prevent-host-death family protein
MTIMTMKSQGHREAEGLGPRRLRRVGVAEAKATFARLVREAPTGPTVVHNRGRDVAVVLSLAEYEALVSTRTRGGAGQRLTEALETWRKRFGGTDFTPEPAKIVPHDWVRRRR